jgi:plasmid stabilization system protein ParE
MNRTLIVAPEAEAEIGQAADWYDQQSRRAALGFRDAVDGAFETIRRNREQVIYRETRRVLLDGYPYALFDTVADRQVAIVSCFHTARDPDLWR